MQTHDAYGPPYCFSSSAAMQSRKACYTVVSYAPHILLRIYTITILATFGVTIFYFFHPGPQPIWTSCKMSHISEWWIDSIKWIRQLHIGRNIFTINCLGIFSWLFFKWWPKYFLDIPFKLHSYFSYYFYKIQCPSHFAHRLKNHVKISWLFLRNIWFYKPCKLHVS